MTSPRLPPRRQRPRSGIERAPQRIWNRHRRHVKRHCCSVPGCQNTPIDFHHTKTRGSGGGDETGVSLCRWHHIEVGTIGEPKFNGKYGIELKEIAREFVRTSPDLAMKEALGLVTLHRRDDR